MRHRRVVSPHFVSNETAKILRIIGIDDDEIDAVIDHIRKKYNVHVYNHAAPFVTKYTETKNVVLYGFGVKYCSIQHGWNHRIYIGKTQWKKNIYDAKRRAIDIAIKWILSHKSQEKCKIMHLSKNGTSNKKQN